MGSNSDWDVMQHACTILKEFGVSFEAKVLSAHRMPDEMFAYAESARERANPSLQSRFFRWSTRSSASAERASQ